MTTHDIANTGPLKGLRLIEMGTLLAGPFCGQLMGDFGAEVIKLEPPGKGDPMREWGQEKAHGMSLWWPVIARNKKSVTLNLREPEGQEIARELISKADFLLENFRPGTMERWNLSYDELREINPGLIMIRVSGYGQTGPIPSAPASAPSVNRWGGCGTSVATRQRLPAAWASASAILWPRRSRASARYRRCIIVNAPAKARSSIPRSTRPS